MAVMFNCRTIPTDLQLKFEYRVSALRLERLAYSTRWPLALGAGLGATDTRGHRPPFASSLVNRPRTGRVALLDSFPARKNLLPRTCEISAWECWIPESSSTRTRSAYPLAGMASL